MNELTSKRRRKPRRLRRLKLDRVDFVERGANPESHITFFKAEDAKPATKSTRKPARKSISQLRREVRELRSRHPELASADEKPVTKDAVEAELERKTAERMRSVSGETREQAVVEVMRAYPSLRERYAEATQPPSGPTRPLPPVEGEAS